MQKFRLILGVALVVTLMGTALVAVAPWQPRYEGKTVQWWFEKFCLSPPNSKYFSLGPNGRMFFDENDREIGDKPMTALRSMPQESVPYLIGVLRRKENQSTLNYRRFWQMLPNALKQFVPLPVDISSLHGNAALALAGLGTNAKPAIPELLDLWDLRGATAIEGLVIRVLRNCEKEYEILDLFIERLADQGKDQRILNIVEALNLSSPGISKALVLILQRGNAGERQRVASIFAKSNPYPNVTFDALKKALFDSDREVRYGAIRACENLGTNALSAKPELEKAADDENTMVRTVARRILDGTHRAAD